MLAPPGATGGGPSSSLISTSPSRSNTTASSVSTAPTAVSPTTTTMSGAAPAFSGTTGSLTPHADGSSWLPATGADSRNQMSSSPTAESPSQLLHAEPGSASSSSQEDVSSEAVSARELQKQKDRMRASLRVTAIPERHFASEVADERGKEMDPSVLEMARPGTETTSAPASRSVSVAPGAGPGGAVTSAAPSPVGRWNDTTPTGAASAAVAAKEQASGDELAKRLQSTKLSATGSAGQARGRAATSPPEYKMPQLNSATETATDAAPPVAPSPSKPIASPAKLNGDNTGVDSIFRLLPRETRPVLMAMLAVEPTRRSTLSDLLLGKGKDALVCRCGGAECGGGMNTPPGTITPEEREIGDEADNQGDEWLKTIDCCSHHARSTGHHTHAKIEGGDGETKKKKFFGH